MSYLQYEVCYPPTTTKMSGVVAKSSGIQFTYNGATHIFGTTASEQLSTTNKYMTTDIGIAGDVSDNIPCGGKLCLNDFLIRTTETEFSNYVLFDSNGNYSFVVPSGVYSLDLCLVGAGGGGGQGAHYGSPSGGNDYCSGGGGGGSGRVAIYTNIAVQPNDIIQITVGKGGNAGYRINYSGNNWRGTNGQDGGSTIAIIRGINYSADGGGGGYGVNRVGDIGGNGGNGGSGGGAGADYTTYLPTYSERWSKLVGYYWNGGNGAGNGQSAGKAELWNSPNSDGLDYKVRDGNANVGTSYDSTTTFMGWTFAVGGGGGGAYAYNATADEHWDDTPGNKGPHTHNFGNGGNGCGSIGNNAENGNDGAVIVKWR